MTDPTTPDSFNRKALSKIITQEVIAELRKDGFITTTEVQNTLVELQGLIEKVEENYRDSIALKVPQESISATINRCEIRADIEEKIDCFDIARSNLVSHFFKAMLSEGISWEDIMKEIAANIPGNDLETMKHLQALESLTLTSANFS